MSRLELLIAWVDRATGTAVAKSDIRVETLKRLVIRYQPTWRDKPWYDELFVHWEQMLPDHVQPHFQAILEELGPPALALADSHPAGMQEIRQKLGEVCADRGECVTRFMRNSATDQLGGRQCDLTKERYPTTGVLLAVPPLELAEEVTPLAVAAVCRVAEDRCCQTEPDSNLYELAVQEARRQVDGWTPGTVLGLGSTRGPLAGPSATRPPRWDEAVTARTLEAKAQRLQNRMGDRLEWDELVRLALSLGVPDDRWLPPTLRALTEYVTQEAPARIRNVTNRYVQVLGNGAVEDARQEAWRKTNLRFERERRAVYVFAERQASAVQRVRVLDLVDDTTEYPAPDPDKPGPQPIAWSTQVLEWRHWRTYAFQEAKDAIATELRLLPPGPPRPPEPEGLPEGPGGDPWGEGPVPIRVGAAFDYDDLDAVRDLGVDAATVLEQRGLGHPLMQGLDQYDGVIVVDAVRQWLAEPSAGSAGSSDSFAACVAELLTAADDTPGLPEAGLWEGIGDGCQRNLVAAELEPGLAHVGGALAVWALSRVRGLNPDAEAPW